MSNIWQTLDKSFFILAPMEDVTDTVFRQVVASTKAPNLFFTEFVNVEGLMTKGRAAISRRFVHTIQEQPLVAQIWGAKPENFYQIAKELSDGSYWGNFVGIDLNMGCPAHKVVRRGSCAGLINSPNLAIEIIQATKEGAGELPVSVKTRCGVNSWVTEEWATILLKQKIAALTIHGRIAKEMSHFPARWDEITKVVALRNQLAPQTKVIGNGDVVSYQDGLEKITKYGVDGVMVGRGIFNNLWFFDSSINPSAISLQTRLAMLKTHIELWQQNWQGQKNFEALKKFYKIYFAGIPDTTNIRHELMLLKSADETLEALKRIIG